LKLNGTHQLLAYADDVNILGGSIHAVKENVEALVVATKEIQLEVNADKTKYMVMSRDRNAGWGHSVKIDNIYIERMEEFKYLGMTITDQNSIQEEIKRFLTTWLKYFIQDHHINCFYLTCNSNVPSCVTAEDIYRSGPS
jgi:hypothetical protein